LLIEQLHEMQILFALAAGLIIETPAREPEQLRLARQAQLLMSRLDEAAFLVN
jgi:hypothetical protein